MLAAKARRPDAAPVRRQDQEVPVPGEPARDAAGTRASSAARSTASRSRAARSAQVAVQPRRTSSRQQGLQGRGEERRRVLRAVQGADRQAPEPVRAGDRADAVTSATCSPCRTAGARDGKTLVSSLEHEAQEDALEILREAVEVGLHPPRRVLRPEPGPEDAVRQRIQRRWSRTPSAAGRRYLQTMVDRTAEIAIIAPPKHDGSGAAGSGWAARRSASPRSARRPRTGSRRCWRT